MISGFTLIELILVLALLVIFTSLAVPTMSRFIRGRALDSEAERMMALMHAAQSRAVSEGMPMMLWLNAPNGEYGMQMETSGKISDPKAEELTLDSTLKMTVPGSANSAGVSATLFNGLPAIKFLPDGTVDEGSPHTVQLTDTDGFSRWLNESANRMGYEVVDHIN